MFRAQIYKLKPSKEQEKILLQAFGNVRYVYNWALNLKTTTYAESKESLSPYTINKHLTKLKKEKGKEWLNYSPSQPLQQSIVYMETAFKKFYKGAGFPKFKSKKSRQSFHYPQGVKVDYSNYKVFLPTVKRVKFFKDRQIEGTIRNATVFKKQSGYYVSILFELVDRKEDCNGIVGIDLGLKDLIVTSDGDKINNPKIFSKSESLLRKEQRHLTRQTKGSKRYIKTCKKIGRLYERITDQRKDFLHKLSTSIAKRYDTVCVEDLNVKGMMKNRCLSKAIGDSGWGILGEMFKYKCNNVVKIGRFEPSSKLCSNCGNIYGELTLKERERTCKDCKAVHDRDVNAAINIKNLGAGALLANAKTSQ